MDRAQESEVLTRRDAGGSIRHSAQNSDITREGRQAALSRQQVTNVTKMFDKKMRFTGEIGNGNVPLDQTISAYRSICQDIAASDEVARRAMFTMLMLPLPISTSMILNGTLSFWFSAHGAKEDRYVNGRHVRLVKWSVTCTL
jgi:hypothetical protein